MEEVRIGLIGTGFMGKAHAQAFQNMALLFPDAPRPRLEIVADVSLEAAQAAARVFGFRRATGDWRALVADPAVDVVDITTPNHLHHQMALAAIAAGKHVYCEKPLAPTAAQAKEMTEAAEAAGVKTLVGFNYLKNPATGLVKQLVESGELGQIVHFRGTFDQDALADPRAPFSWRFERALAGSGALDDLGAHIINLAQHLVGEIAEVCGQTQTIHPERPVAGSGVGYLARAGEEAELRRVENEDQVQFLVRFANGAGGTIEASRIASGRKLWLTYEVTGTKGGIYFTQERMNEVQLYRSGDPSAEQGFRTIYIGPDHPHYAQFYPVAGIGLGYSDQKVIEAYELIDGIAQDRPLAPDFRAGWQTSQVIEAVLDSVAQKRWVAVAAL
jgi:predicted dehydrogenase